jgi:hypothetical protein
VPPATPPPLSLGDTRERIASTELAILTARLAEAEARLAAVHAPKANQPSADSALATATAKVAIAAQEKIEKAKGMLQIGVVVVPAVSMRSIGRPNEARGMDALPTHRLAAATKACGAAGNVPAEPAQIGAAGMISTSGQIHNAPMEISALSREGMRENDDNFVTSYLIPRLAHVGVACPPATVAPAPGTYTQRFEVPNHMAKNQPGLFRTLAAIRPELAKQPDKLGLSSQQFAKMYDEIIMKVSNFEQHSRLSVSELCFVLEQEVGIKLDEQPKVESLLTHILEMFRQVALAVTTESLIALHIIKPEATPVPPALFPIASAVRTANATSGDDRLAQHGVALREDTSNSRKRTLPPGAAAANKRVRPGDTLSPQVSPRSATADSAASSGAAAAAVRSGHALADSRGGGAAGVPQTAGGGGGNGGSGGGGHQQPHP